MVVVVVVVAGIDVVGSLGRIVSLLFSHEDVEFPNNRYCTVKRNASTAARLRVARFDLLLLLLLLWSTSSDVVVVVLETKKWSGSTTSCVPFGGGGLGW